MFFAIYPCQQHGEDLEPLLTVILVFMDSPQFMRNPHLRGGMAEALEALLPPWSTARQPAYLSSQYVYTIITCIE